jgi:hypothetical protein
VTSVAYRVTFGGTDKNGAQGTQVIASEVKACRTGSDVLQESSARAESSLKPTIHLVAGRATHAIILRGGGGL